MGSIGLASGGQVIMSAREKYLKALTALVRLASLQTAFFTLDEQIKMTNRRVNALENVGWLDKVRMRARKPSCLAPPRSSRPFNSCYFLRSLFRDSQMGLITFQKNWMKWKGKNFSD
eukprot:GHVN01071614.1.p1 GENE.GHVN01071614.1~~GHVN01071614.1.p1  ORF type:complete len:117 (+),score=10.81 GHVN01071614.1:834-1184(+)